MQTFFLQAVALTPENILALAAIDSFTRRSGSGPTMRQLAAVMRLKAHSAARHHVVRLGELELITFERVGRTRQIAARTIRLTPAGKRELARRVGHG